MDPNALSSSRFGGGGGQRVPHRTNQLFLVMVWSTMVPGDGLSRKTSRPLCCDQEKDVQWYFHNGFDALRCVLGFLWKDAQHPSVSSRNCNVVYSYHWAKDPLVDFLLDNNEGKAWLVALSKGQEGLRQLLDLVVTDYLQLSITNTITIDYDSLWQSVVDLQTNNTVSETKDSR